jgi:amphiphysin
MLTLCSFFVALFTAGVGFATHFAAVFKTFNGEYDLAGKHPEAAHTIKNMDAYGELMEDLKAAVQPELELIQSRIVGPVTELKDVLKAVRKSITKREHKVSV